jgi:hypothetical protein
VAVRHQSSSTGGGGIPACLQMMWRMTLTGGRTPMLADIVGKAFWPNVEAICAFGRTVRPPAHPARRYTCLDPGDGALLEVRGNKVPFSFVPVLVHEVRDAGPPRIGVAFPVADEGERRACRRSWQLVIERVGVSTVLGLHTAIFADSRRRRRPQPHRP